MLVTPDGIVFDIPKLGRCMSKRELEGQVEELERDKEITLNDCEQVTTRLKELNDKLSEANATLAVAKRQLAEAPSKEEIRQAKSNATSARKIAKRCGVSLNERRRARNNLELRERVTRELVRRREVYQEKVVDAEQSIQSIARAIDNLTPWIDQFAQVVEALDSAIAVRRYMLQAMAGGDLTLVARSLLDQAGVDPDEIRPGDDVTIRQDELGVTNVFIGDVDSADHAHHVLNGDGVITYTRPKGVPHGPDNFTPLGRVAI